MASGTILFVHGTGCRQKDYNRSLINIRNAATAAGIGATFTECSWGDPLGASFEGKSLPAPPSEEELRDQQQDFAQWYWLLDDPLLELYRLTIPNGTPTQHRMLALSQRAQWEVLWDEIGLYHASLELTLLLQRGGLSGYWSEAWSEIISSPITRTAFEQSDHELPEAARALARALVAQLHRSAIKDGYAGPNRELRDSLILRLLTDWNQQVYAYRGIFSDLVKRLATRTLREYRSAFTSAISRSIGDILLYQARGSAVRDFIREKVTCSEGPVTLLAHSLGGIACVDLLALADPPPVAHLVTVGSQPSHLYELGALFSIKPPKTLPQGFPKWLNFYDRNDFLSFVAQPLFPNVKDVEVQSGQPFPDSHSAYLSNPDVWSIIAEFIAP